MRGGRGGDAECEESGVVVEAVTEAVQQCRQSFHYGLGRLAGV